MRGSTAVHLGLILVQLMMLWISIRTMKALVRIHRRTRHIQTEHSKLLRERKAVLDQTEATLRQTEERLIYGAKVLKAVRNQTQPDPTTLDRHLRN